MAVDTPTPQAEEAVQPASSGMSWRTQAYFLGGLVGVLLGLLSAYLYIRASKEVDKEGVKPSIKTGDAMRLTLAVLGLVRQIAEMGNK